MPLKKTTYSFLLYVTLIIAVFLPIITNAKDKSKISVVVIDPGHGGKDWGASVGSAKEKNIVLDISLKLGKLIENNYPNIKVIYTRKSDVFIPLHKRADIANKSEADVFLSVHVNAVEAKSVRGTESFVLGLHRNNDNLEVAKKENAVILLEDNYTSTYEGFDPNSPESYIMFETMQEEYQAQSIMLASNIQNQFKNHSKRIDRSVKMAGFLVLRRTTMPSVLIETGFLSHSTERKYLLSSTGQNSLALSIYKAFDNYKKEIEEHSKFNLVPKDNVSNPEQPSSSKKQIAIVEKEQATQASKSRIIARSEEPKNNTTIQKQPNITEDNLYFTVQLMALKRKMDTTAENFMGETNVFRVDGGDFNRYFIGKFATEKEAKLEKVRIQKKFPNAFVVAFRNNKLISVKKALETK